MSYAVDGEELTWRVEVDIDKDQIDTNLTNKDVYIDLSGLGADFWDNVKSDGGDIRVTLSDGTTRIPLELKNFNQGAEDGQVYSKASSISSSVDTKVYLYWGNAALSQPAASSAYGSENVWDSDYILVAHLEESGDGTADEFKDSTSNDNHGQGGGGTGSKVPDRVTDFLGYAQDYIAANKDHINFGNNASLDIQGAITIEILVSHDGLGSHEVYAIKAHPVGTGVIPYEFRKNTANQVHFAIGGVIDISTGTLAANTEYYIAVTWDGTTSGTNKYIYLDGALDSSHVQNFAMGSNPSVNTTVGSMDNTNNFNAFDGTHDEIRISKTDRSAAWIKATNINLKTPLTFYTIGAYEESPVAGDGVNAILFGSPF